MLFYTDSAEHIAKTMRMKKGRFILTKFSDGEIYSRVEEDVKGKDVWVLASTQPPADNILELAFLLDSLSRGGAKINLMILYFGYARQDRIAKEGEALSAKIVSDLLRKFGLSKMLVMHIHSSRIKKFLDYEDILPIHLFSAIIRRMEVVVAPDRGALDLARKVSRDYGLALAYMEKVRPGIEEVEITRLVGNVKRKKVVIIDDMISTGGTVIKASQRLMKSGAKEVHVIATHGIFSGNAVKNLEKSRIRSVYVTNTIKPNYKSKIIKTVDVSKFVESILSPVTVSRD
jgi:ribose-phosphate pyrophosphokinase